MTDRQERREPRRDRARKRAIRAQAAEAGVPYSVAARQISPESRANTIDLASRGRTVYPMATDEHRRTWVETRLRRSLSESIKDTRRAAILPAGRAAHLAERFPPTRGLPKTGVGLLYHGDGREHMLAMAYLAVCQQAPSLVPDPGELAWIAELGEETAVDTACAEIDRAVRRFLDDEHGVVCHALETLLRTAAKSDHWHLRVDAIRLYRLFETMVMSVEAPGGEPHIGSPPLAGVRQILDALLVIADDGHAPGTRVRLLAPPFSGELGTIVGLRWGAVGPPVGYDVHPDNAHFGSCPAKPYTLAVLPGQEAFPGDGIDIASDSG